MKFNSYALMILGIFFSTHIYGEQGDVERGKALSATCVVCHGVSGNSAIQTHPKIAGQHAGYLFKQLKDFKQGANQENTEGRADPIMSGIISQLSEQDFRDLAAFYAEQPISEGYARPDAVELAEKIYLAGDADRGIPACASCHGPSGKGAGLAGFPRLSFQHAEYLRIQLLKFKSGERKNDLNSMMGDIAKKLGEKEIEALASYISGLH